MCTWNDLQLPTKRINEAVVQVPEEDMQMLHRGFAADVGTQGGGVEIEGYLENVAGSAERPAVSQP